MRYDDDNDDEPTDEGVRDEINTACRRLQIVFMSVGNAIFQIISLRPITVMVTAAAHARDGLLWGFLVYALCLKFQYLAVRVDQKNCVELLDVRSSRIC